jgi:hypothetical protein
MKKNMIKGLLFAMVWSVVGIFSLSGFSQEGTNKTGQGMKTDVGVGVTMQKYTEIESQLEAGMPMILEKIQDTANLVKQNKFQEGREYLANALKEARSDEKIFTKDSPYKEIADYVDKMGDALTLADHAMANRQKKIALDQLARAYRMTKVISESPVLKMVASEVAINQADRLIMSKDYESAGIFLQRAVDNITEAEKDPRMNTPELNQLKNDIIITQQQVVLGKMKDEKRLKNFYPGLAAARVNTLNTYYDIWTRSNMPWEMY